MRRIFNFVPRNLLWLDVLYPVALVLVLFTGFTKLTYTGPLDHTLASQADFTLLEQTLRIVAPFHHDIVENVALVTIDDNDVMARQHVSIEGLTDLTIQDYAQLIERLYSNGAALVVVRLLPALQVDTTEAYEPLLMALNRLNAKESIILAYPQTGQFKLHPDLKKVATVLDDDVCMKGVLLCPYVKEWDDWIIQVLINRVSRMVGHEPPEGALTKVFPIRFPTFIVNAVRPDALPRIPVATILNGSPLPQVKDKIVVVGREATSVQLDLAIKTAYSIHDKLPTLDGWGRTSLHTMWAQVAAMPFENGFIRVATMPQVIAATAVSCGTVLIAFLLFGVGLGGMLTIAWMTLLNVVNTALLAIVHFYVPLFTVMYFSMMTFIVAGFGRLSFEAFSRWLASERAQQYSRAADLKGNFISLLSHNLNTPVAKMQGMIGILLGSLKGSGGEPALASAYARIAKLEATIRSILCTTAIDERSLMAAPVTLTSLRDEFNVTAGATLKRAGVLCSIRIDVEDDDLELHPVVIDKKILVNAVGALAWLSASDSTPTSVNIRWVARHTASDAIELVIEVPVSASRGPLIRTAGAQGRPEDAPEHDFFEEIVTQLAARTAATYGGDLEFISSPTPLAKVTLLLL